MREEDDKLEKYLKIMEINYELSFVFLFNVFHSCPFYLI